MSNVTKLETGAAAAPPRVAPHNAEIEQALLGAILLNNDAFYRVSDFLQPAHFFEPIHQKFFELIGSLVRAGKVASPLTLKTFLPPDLEIGGFTASQYLTRLVTDAAMVVNVADHGRTIFDLYRRRSLITVGADILNAAYDAPPDFSPNDQVEAAERQLYEIAETGTYGGGFLRMAETLARSVDNIARAYQRDGKLSGLATGLTDLDRLMGGLQASDLVVIGGRPGMGKTALGTNIAYNVAKAYRGEVGADGHVVTLDGGIVGFFSLEMSAEQIGTRMLSEQTEIPSHRLRRGEIDPAEFDRIATRAREMESMPLYVDEAGGISIAQLAARARRIKRQRGLDLVVVDYIQLMAGVKQRGGDKRVQEVTEITTGLKALAKELNVPIIALSQLSRVVESRDDKRPQLSDLRESGSIEQDADVVIFVFREEYYLKNREPRAGSEEHFKWLADMDAAHGKADLIVSKQRHGPTGVIPVQFKAEVTRFSDLADSGRFPERL